MGVVRMRLRAELRRRWLALFGLALLLGVAGGAVLAAAAGARRTNATIDETLAHTLPADVLLNPDDLSSPAAQREWARVDDLPNIAAVATVGGMAAGRVDAHGNIDFNAMVGDETMAALDDHLIRDVDREALVAGRYFDPSRPDEAIVSQGFAKKHHVGVGDRMTMRFFPPEAQAELQAGRVPHGIDEAITVTGVVLPLDDATRATDDPRLSPTIMYTPALARSPARDGAEPVYEGKCVRLRHGTADLPAFESAARAATPDAALNFQETAQTTDRARRANRPYVVALWCFTALAAIATIAIVGQALSRSQRFESQDRSTLRSLGVSDGSLIEHVVLRGLIIGVTGALVAVVVAIATSPFMPIGPMRPLAIDRGVRADWMVLLLGAAAVVLLAVVATLLGLREFRIGRTRPRLLPVTGDVPAPVFAGTRFALDPGRGPTAVPLRSTLLGVTLALGALVAALVYGAGLTQFTSTPGRYGWSWHYQVEFDDQAAAHAALTHDRDVAAI